MGFNSGFKGLILCQQSKAALPPPSTRNHPERSWSP